MYDGPDIPVDPRDQAREACRIVVEHAEGERCDYCKSGGWCPLLAGARRVLELDSTAS